MELRSNKGRGRPAGTFADPVRRVRAWNWLDCVQAIAGVADATALDKHGIAGNMDLTAKHRFQSIADDGFDPGRVLATQTQSMLEYVSKKPGYQKTKEAYLHPLWRALQDRHWKWPEETSFIANKLFEIGVVTLDHHDERRADNLGLEWPSVFRREFVRSADEASEGNPWLEPITHPLTSLVNAAKLASLDGMLALLLLYRRSLDTAAFEQAKDCHEVLRAASEIFVSSFNDEVLDTWRYVVNTRMLAWIPDFEPSDEAIRHAEQKVHQDFEKVQGVGKTRGRKKLHPAKSISGKIARRWRRRILMRACAKTPEHLNPFAGFQPLTPFNQWLMLNRNLIDAHVSKADYLLVVGEGTDPETEAELLRDLPPLEIPVDDHHQFKRPYVDSNDDDRFGGCAFDLIDIRTVNIGV